jgi:predicted Co/Zn/Cd cation transporter (cation efflux family)
MLGLILMTGVFVCIIVFFVFSIKKILKSKKIKWPAKSFLLSGLIGIWILVQEYDFFINIGGPNFYFKQAIEKDFGIPFFLFLIVFFGIFGIIMSALTWLVILVVKKYLTQ